MTHNDTSPSSRFEALFNEHSTAILGYAIRRVHAAGDAADIVSETFLVAWRRLDAVPHQGARLWLYGIARNVLANHHRGFRRHDRLSERLRQTLVQSLPENDQDDRVDAVREAMAALSEDDREVLRLAFWEELQPADVAIVLNISDVTARSRLHRARKRLRARLEDQANPPAHDCVLGSTPTPVLKETP